MYMQYVRVHACVHTGVHAYVEAIDWCHRSVCVCGVVVVVCVSV